MKHDHREKEERKENEEDGFHYLKRKINKQKMIGNRMFQCKQTKQTESQLFS